MKKCFLLLLVSSSLFAQNFSNGFNFNLPWNDSTTQKFLPKFPIIPIPQNDFIKADADGNFNLGGKKIKFWGGNCVADGAFPTKDKSPQIASRMRKVGINLIRFHHIDNGWGGLSLLTGFDTRVLNTTNLDLLEYFISKLKENGIFINMNLNVSRQFKVADGVADADSINKFCLDFAKALTLFDPYLIMLEKEYAQQLLTHVNPYTGKSLVNDPVMAMVETNNENSLYRAWHENQLKPVASGGKILYRHAKYLDSLWCDFLSKKYGTTSALQSAWNKGTTIFGQGEQVKNGGFENPVNPNVDWELELHSPASGNVSRDNINPYSGIYSGKIAVTNSTGTDWHIQFKQKTITIKKDSSYTVTFAARSDSQREITVSAMNNDSPWTWYGGTTVTVTSTWKVFTFSFKSPEDNLGHTRLSFSLGKTIANYWIDNVSFTKAGVTGLAENESLEAKNIRRIDYSDCVSYSDQRVKDISQFYIQLQQNYFADMKNYLHNTLGVKVPIVGTNWNYGAADLASIAVGDYVDNHSYWDHPQFPSVPWSSTDWLINNKPMVNDNNGGTMPGLFAGVPMVGKPYTISEYNHAFPNRYQSEAILFIAGYSSFHGVDGIMMFDYNGARDYETDMINGYFSINRNSVFMSLFPSCAFAFRNGLIDQSKNMLKINYSPETIYLLPKNGGNSDWSGPLNYDRRLALRNAVRTESFASSAETNFNSLPTTPTSPFKTDTDQIILNTTDGTLTVAAEKFNGAAGFLYSLKNTRIGDFVITDFGSNDFGTLTWVSLTNEKLSVSQRSLITLASKIQNSGMIWNSYNNSVNNNWGGRPTSVYPLNIKLDLNIYADSIKVYPLDSRGKENIISPFVIKPAAQNHFLVNLDQNKYSTLWFGVEKFGSGNPSSVKSENKIPIEFKLAQNYPNPFNPTTTIKYSIPVETGYITSLQHVTLKVFDMLGREIASLVNEEKPSGNYEVKFNVETLHSTTWPSGVYFYKLSVGNFTQTKKMVLMK